MAENPSWAEPSTWVGGAGLLAILGSAVKAVLDHRRDKGQQRATSEDLVRDDLMGMLKDQRAEMEAIRARCNAMEQRLDTYRERENGLHNEIRAIRTENESLRSRYHRYVRYVQEVVGTLDLYAERLGIPENDRPRIPTWIDETVPGPTARGPRQGG